MTKDEEIAKLRSIVANRDANTLKLIERLRGALVEIRDNPYKGECECGAVATEALGE